MAKKFDVQLVQVFPMKPGKDKIYTVTCYEPRNEKRYGFPANSSRRTWGWFPNKARAIRSVLNNETGMFEIGYYTYAVIEEYRSGIIASAHNAWWYKYDHKTKKVKAVPAPKFAKNIINYAMG